MENDGATTRTARRRGSSSTHDALDPAHGQLQRVLARRYVLRREIGSGGMGVVYEAYDRELARNVAIKLLLRAGPESARRLLREAQTLARLSHPNLVPVFDAGSADGELFIAMELVEGASLDRWVAERRPTWRESLPLLLAAGRGLEHAHHCGVLHRDFKPANVLVGGDGRVRVVDFGLARPLPSAGSAPSLSTLGRAPARSTDSDGSGTPAYMPPEALAGGEVDARGDQFSFCVSAWEVLCGHRPLRDPDTTAVVLDVDAETLVPSRLRRALARGMARDPDARHASMRALLAEIEHSRSRRRAAGVIAIAIGVGGLTWASRGPSCDEAGGDLGYGERTRERVRAAIETTAMPDDVHVVDTTIAGLDAYASQWALMRRGACEAHRRGGESDALFERRSRCLDARLRSFTGLVELLASAPRAGVVLAAPDAIERLPPLASCADAAALMSTTWSPPPAQRAQAEALEVELDALRLLADTGQTAAALGGLDTLVARTAELPRSPVAARTQLLLAKARRSEEDVAGAFAAVREAATAAASARDDETLAEALLEQVSLLAADATRVDEFETMAPLVEDVLARLDSASDAASARLIESRARMALALGRFEDAVGHAEQARTKAESGPALRLADVRTTLALALVRAGRPAEASLEFEAALAIAREQLGPGHPRLARMSMNLALTQAPERREQTLRDALAVLVRAYPDGHADVAAVQSNLGLALLDRGAFAEAEQMLRGAIAMQRRTWPRGHPHLANTLQFLADLLGEVGRRDEALGIVAEAIALRRRLLPTDHPDIGRALRLRGAILFDSGRPAQARNDYEDALALFERSLPADHPLLLGPLTGIGECAVLLGDAERALEVCTRTRDLVASGDARDEVPSLSCLASAHVLRAEYELAVPLLERAHELWTPETVGPLLAAQIDLQLARTLDEAGRDHDRVVALARQTLALASEVPGARDRLLADARMLGGDVDRTPASRAVDLDRPRGMSRTPRRMR